VRRARGQLATREASGEFDGMFECARCLYECRALVQATGHAYVTSERHGELSSFVEDVSDEAARAAGAAAARTLWFVACPRCHLRHPHARRYRIQIVLAALGLGLASGIIAFVGMMKFRGDRSLGGGEAVLGLSVLSAIVGAVVSYAKLRRPWVDVDARVRLFPE
jgi:hypothetical protein